jgi:regulator of protease activity HflC (stomatin/prohibitin superfamily)
MKNYALILLVVVAIQGLYGCHTVEPGHVGVQIWFSEIQNETLSEGLNIINPLMDVTDMSLQTQNMTMSRNNALLAMSSDQLSMEVHVTVLFHLNKSAAPGILRLMPEYQNDVVFPSIRVAARDAIRMFNAVDAVSTSRQKVGEIMETLVRERLGRAMKKRSLPEDSIIIDDVQLRNIMLPQELRNSIARVQKQRQAGHEREQSIETARQEAIRQRTEEEGQAKVRTIKANNEAKIRLIRANAEAQANRIISKSLSPSLLQLKEIEAKRAVLSSSSTRTVFLPTEGAVPSILMKAP